MLWEACSEACITTPNLKIQPTMVKASVTNLDDEESTGYIEELQSRLGIVHSLFFLINNSTSIFNLW